MANNNFQGIVTSLGNSGFNTNVVHHPLGWSIVRVVGRNGQPFNHNGINFCFSICFEGLFRGFANICDVIVYSPGHGHVDSQFEFEVMGTIQPSCGSYAQLLGYLNYHEIRRALMAMARTNQPRAVSFPRPL